MGRSAKTVRLKDRKAAASRHSWATIAGTGFRVEEHHSGKCEKEHRVKSGNERRILLVWRTTPEQTRRIRKEKNL